MKELINLLKAQIVAIETTLAETKANLAKLETLVKEETSEEPSVVIIKKEYHTPVFVISSPKEENEQSQVMTLDEEAMLANKLAILAGLAELKGTHLEVGLKQFINKDKELPFLDKHHLNVALFSGDTLVKERYVAINALGDLEMPLRKMGAMSWNKASYTPKRVLLML